jgi:hypothetical protein
MVDTEKLILQARERGLELRPGFYGLSEQPFFRKIHSPIQINSDSKQQSSYVCLPGGAITDNEVETAGKIMLEIINEN